jgi:hypothetical protein
MRLKHCFALALLSLPLSVRGEDCRVIDTELQGFYEGGCSHGLADGEGNARGTAEYRGGFREGKKDGHGVKTWAWGDRYEGEFKEDRKNGHGMYVWGAGSQWAGQRYVGGFVADKRQGFGTYYWPNGDRFDGEWKDDLRYGYTVMEQRRLTGYAARKKAMGEPGVNVCGETKAGNAQQVIQLRGVTTGLEDTALTVQITGVSASDTGALPSFGPGAVVRGSIWDWTPCL